MANFRVTDYGASIRLAGLFSMTFLVFAAPAAVGGTFGFSASGVNTGTGNTVSGTLTFVAAGDPGCSTIAGSMCIILTDTSAATVSRGDLVSGFFFSLSTPYSSLTLATGMGTLVQSGQSAITGANLLVASSGYGLVESSTGNLGTNTAGTAFPYQYGVSTVGDGGIFNGNTVGADEYALVAAGTNLSLKGLGGLQYVQTTATFVVSGLPSGFVLSSPSQITNVGIAYGSAPDVLLPGHYAPEPASWVGVASGLLAGAFVLKRRRQRAPASG